MKGVGRAVPSHGSCGWRRVPPTGTGKGDGSLHRAHHQDVDVRRRVDVDRPAHTGLVTGPARHGVGAPSQVQREAAIGSDMDPCRRRPGSGDDHGPRDRPGQPRCRATGRLQRSLDAPGWPAGAQLIGGQVAGAPPSGGRRRPDPGPASRSTGSQDRSGHDQPGTDPPHPGTSAPSRHEAHGTAHD